MWKTHRSIRVLLVVLASASLCGTGADGRASAASRTLRAGQTAQSQPPPPEQQQTAPPPAPQQPIFRTGINVVRVDVIVSDKQGAAVADLQQSDFEVSEDGKPQTIASFKLIRIDGNVGEGAEPARPINSDYAEESEAARDDVRLFAIFLDDYHVRRGASLSVKDPLTRFINTQLGPTDMVGLMYPLTPLSDVRMTRNHDALAGAVNQFYGRKYDYEPRNEFEQQYANYPASVVERIRNEVSLSALKGLVTHLGSLREGRKAVILVSEGFTNILPPQLRDPIASMPGFRNPDRNNPMAGEGDVREDTANFFASTEILTDLRLVYDAANRNNTAIYTLDPRGLATNEFDINENVGMRADQATLRSTMDTLRILSEQTDGRAIVNRNDLDAGLRQVVRDSSAYYLIGYNSTQAPSDGKFHEITVRVRRPGVQWRARKGYWALTAEETARATAPPAPGPPAAIERALGSIAGPAHGRAIRTWVGMTRGENGRTRVTFVWEPIPPVPGVRSEEAARVALIAAGSEGRTYFRGKVPDVALASAAPAAAASAGAGAPLPAPSRVTFEAAPGRMHLKISVEGRAAQVIDSDMTEVNVPDLTQAQTSLSTPEVLKARNARELQMIIANPDTVPVASREFRRSDRLLIRFEAYGPGDVPPEATARLLNRAGQPMSDLPVTAQLELRVRQVDLPLSSLAPGEYLIEIKAKGESGEATELVPLKIAG